MITVMVARRYHGLASVLVLLAAGCGGGKSSSDGAAADAGADSGAADAADAAADMGADTAADAAADGAADSAPDVMGDLPPDAPPIFPVFVDLANTGGTEDGKTWATAFRTIQPAVTSATAGREVWIAQGTYHGAGGGAPVLTLKSKVTVRGGFAGTESALADRPTPLLATILDGAGDSTHVVVGANDATLDGVTVTGGDAGSNGTGGGMNNQAVSPTLTRVVFSKNKGGYGGGMYNNDASPTLTDVVFEDNQTAGSGGGMENEGASAPVMTRVVFRRNKTDGRGGGLYHSGDPLTLTDAIFVANKASSGGGIDVYSVSLLTLDGAVFAANHADENGGAIAQESSKAMTIRDAVFAGNDAAGGGAINAGGTFDLSNVVFLGNSASIDGGGMLDSSTSGKLSNAAFIDNTSAMAAAGISFHGMATVATNVLFSGNTADFGGAATLGSGSTTITNATFHGNTAPSGGGALVFGSGPANVVNSIFWPTTDSISDPTSMLVHTYDCAKTMLTGAGNVALSASPFVATAPASGQVFLDATAGAPCMDAGSEAAANDAMSGFTALGLPSWASLTTLAAGTLDADGAGANDVDMGRHYLPGDVTIATFSANPAGATWTTSGAASCVIVSQADGSVIAVQTASVASGSAPHGQDPGAVLTLVCRGALAGSATAAANATVL